VATVTGYTAARSQQIEDGTVIGGAVNGSGDLILTKHDASTINAGHVVGPTGSTGPTGPAGSDGYPTGIMYGEQEGTSGNNVTLVTNATDYLVPVSVPTTKLTFTLTTQRRVRIIVSYRPNMASGTGGAYTVRAGYVAGSTATLTGAVILGQPGSNQIFIAGIGGTFAVTVRGEHTVLLAAGTYTVFPVAQRPVGGGNTDTANLGYVAVYDVGSA
jgi:hypothetical protein